MRILQQLRSFIIGQPVTPPIWEDCFPIFDKICDEEIIKQARYFFPEIEFRVIDAPEKSEK